MTTTTLPVQRVGYPRVFTKDKGYRIVSKGQDDPALDVCSLLRRKDRGVFYGKEPQDPARVTSESAFYKLNLKRSEKKIPDDTVRLLAKSGQVNRRGKPLLTSKKEQASRPSKQISDHENSEEVEILTIHDEEPISYLKLSQY